MTSAFVGGLGQRFGTSGQLLSSAPALNDVQQLMADLGGTTAMPFIYDGRYNVSGTASAPIYDDAVSIGRSPQFIGSGAGINYDSSTKVCTLGASTGLVASVSANAIFDPSVNGLTIVTIAALGAGSGFMSVGVTDTSTSWMGVGAQNTTVLRTTNGGGSVGDFFLATPVSATRRLFSSAYRPINFFGAGGTPDTVPATAANISFCFGRVGPNLAFVTQQGSLGTGLSWKLQAGALFGVTPANVAFRAIVGVKGAVTGAQWDKIAAWAIANHSVVEDTTNSRQSIHIGDSLTFGTGSTNGTDDYVTQLMAMTGYTTNMDYANRGQPSMCGSAMVLDFPSGNEPIFRHTSKTVNNATIWALHNDLALSHLTAAQAANNCLNIVDQAKAAGATSVTVVTQPQSATINSSVGDAVRLAANALLVAGVTARGGSAAGYLLADCANIPQFNPPGVFNPTYYASDNVHFLPAGYALIAANIFAAQAGHI